MGTWLYRSSNNIISGNNITANNWGIVLDSSSNNNTVSWNSITANNRYGIDLYDSSNNSIVGNIFVDDGLTVWGSYGNVVVDNLVNGKPLVYLEGVSNYRVEDAGQVILVNCNNILVENLNLSHTDIGIQLWRTKNTTITVNNITANNWYGIELDGSSNNSIVGNNIINNRYGIELDGSSCNTVSGNTIVNNKEGVYLYSSSCNTVSGNTIVNNKEGVFLGYSSKNSIYHNNFVNNTEQARLFLPYYNIWDGGYPSGGNYWSDYTDVDEKSGPNQDKPGGDGIWDHPYVIDEDNVDRYPLVGKPTTAYSGYLSDLTATYDNATQIMEYSWKVNVNNGLGLWKTKYYLYYTISYYTRNVTNVPVSWMESTRETISPGKSYQWKVELYDPEGNLVDTEWSVANSTLERRNPTVTLTPSSQSGVAGSTLTYVVSVTNNDPSSFGASTFSLTYSVPSGWSASLSKTSVTLNPGETDSSITLSVTSPSTAPAGEHTISVIATNTEETSYQGAGSAKYIVGAATLNLHVVDEDGEDFFATIYLDDEWKGCLSKTSLTLAPGEHHIVVTRLDYEPVERWITLANGETIDLTITMKWSPARLVVSPSIIKEVVQGGSKLSKEISILNSGVSDLKDVTLSASGDISDWTVFSDNHFDVSPANTKKVSVTFNIPDFKQNLDFKQGIIKISTLNGGREYLYVTLISPSLNSTVTEIALNCEKNDEPLWYYLKYDGHPIAVITYINMRAVPMRYVGATIFNITSNSYVVDKDVINDILIYTVATAIRPPGDNLLNVAISRSDEYGQKMEDYIGNVDRIYSSLKQTHVLLASSSVLKCLMLDPSGLLTQARVLYELMTLDEELKQKYPSIELVSALLKDVHALVELGEASWDEIMIYEDAVKAYNALKKGEKIPEALSH
ncbi:hypothetical protein DRO69_13625, partial [Candidatus Bathyarchaeota archaeon]